MTTRVSEMTQAEFREMLESVVEEKLLELFRDPDEGLSLKKSVRDRLQRQKEAVVAGERGEPLDDVLQRLGLE